MIINDQLWSLDLLTLNGYLKNDPPLTLDRPPAIFLELGSSVRRSRRSSLFFSRWIGDKSLIAVPGSGWALKKRF